MRPRHVHGPGRPTESEPIETELDLEYLVYGLFERSDRPDGAFLSKRWVPLEQLLERGGLGTLQAKIGEWEASRAARQKALVDALDFLLYAQKADSPLFENRDKFRDNFVINVIIS